MQAGRRSSSDRRKKTLHAESRADTPRAPRSPPWRLVATLMVLGVILVVAGLFVSPSLMLFGALCLVGAPLCFLLAAPPPPEHKYDFVSDAYSRVFDPRWPPRR